MIPIPTVSPAFDSDATPTVRSLTEIAIALWAVVERLDVLTTAVDLLKEEA
jgi:hypothetical protein